MGNDKHRMYLPMRNNRTATDGTIVRREKLNAGRIIWTTLHKVSVAIYKRKDDWIEGLPEELQEKYRPIHEDEDNVTLSLRNQSTAKSYFGITLTALTEDELILLREVINHSIDLALPIVRQRDNIANEAYDVYDDDSLERIYRSVPELFVRKGAIDEHNQSLLDRLEDTATVVRSTRGGRRTPEPGGAVADGDSRDDSSEHNGAEAGGD